MIARLALEQKRQFRPVRDGSGVISRDRGAELSEKVREAIRTGRARVAIARGEQHQQN
jgi:hypothetical protein